MGVEKTPPPPPDDIPAWFMTFSDVITLLMTFFILLLTFSTTEPDRFERVQRTIFVGGKGTGIVGAKLTGPENESFVHRIRPRAARMAMVGSEMPPYQTEPSKKSIGAGLQSLSKEEVQQDSMSTNQFLVKLNQIINDSNQLTPKGSTLASMLSGPLTHLPIHLAIQCSSSDQFDEITKFVIQLYEAKAVRPGHVAIGLASDVPTGSVRFSIERYDQ